MRMCKGSLVVVLGLMCMAHAVQGEVLGVGLLGVKID